MRPVFGVRVPFFGDEQIAFVRDGNPERPFEAGGYLGDGTLCSRRWLGECDCCGNQGCDCGAAMADGSVLSVRVHVICLQWGFCLVSFFRVGFIAHRMAVRSS